MRNNRILIWTAAFVIAIGLLAGAAYAQSTSSAATGSLSLTNLTITPTPVVAGSNITISFQLFNSYSQSLSQVNLDLEAQNPILNVSPSHTSYINTIGTGLYGGLGYNLFTYKLHVPPTLTAGEYTIDVVATYQTTEGTAGTSTAATSTMPINIYVYGEPQISLNVLPESQITPGSDFTATITAVNSGTDTARNVTMQILSTNSFAPNGPSTFQLGAITADASSQATASIFTYQNVSGGTNYLQALITYTSQEGISSNEIVSVPINILLNSPNIVASVVSATPPQLLPGGNQTISVLIQNTGTGIAKNLSLSFLNGTGVSASGAASYFFVGSLSPGGSVTESVFINANHNANQSSYSLPVLVRYQYENYQGNVTKTIGVPIKLQSGAVYNITSVSGALGLGVSYRPVTFRIKNIGNEEATGITLSLQTVYPITPTTPDAYVPSLAPGQSANVTFYVNVDSSGNAGQYPVTLYEQWRQPNGATNQQYSGSNNYFIVVSNGNGYGWIEAIAALVVLAIIGVIAYRRVIRPRIQKKAINSKAKK